MSEQLPKNETEQMQTELAELKAMARTLLAKRERVAGKQAGPDQNKTVEEKKSEAQPEITAKPAINEENKNKETKKQPTEPKEKIVKEKKVDKTKAAENELSKIKRNEKWITERIEELLKQDISQGVAEKIAEVENIIELAVQREKILEENPEIKDSKRRLETIRKSKDSYIENLTRLIQMAREEQEKNKLENEKHGKPESTTPEPTPEPTKPETKPEPVIVDGYKAGDTVELDAETTKPVEPTPPVSEPTVEPEPIIPKEKSWLAKKMEKITGGIKNIKEKVFGFFSRKEEPGKEEPGKNLSPEKIENLDEILSKIEKGRESQNPLVKKGIKIWEEWGNNKGWKGTAFRLAKMATSLALIGVISSSIVGPSALATLGGTNSYLVRKMTFGMILGTGMELWGKEIPDKYKKWIPVVLGALGIGVSTIITGGLAPILTGGLAMTAGLTSKYWNPQKLIKSEEKANQKLQEKKEELIRSFEKEELNENNVRLIESEYQKILKRHEKWRILRGMGRSLAKLTTGVAISTAVLEASAHGDEIKNEEKETQAPVKQTEPVDKIQHPIHGKDDAEGISKGFQHEEKPEETKIEKVDDTKPEGNNIGSKPETTEAETETVSDFMKMNSTEQAIKLGMYVPGAEAESMNVQSGTVSFEGTDGTHIEVKYDSDGAIQTLQNLKEEIVKHYGNTTIPEGKIDTHYVDMEGKSHDQVLFEGDKITEKYEGTMFDSDRSNETQNNLDDNGQSIKIIGSADGFVNQGPEKIEGSADGFVNQSEAPVNETINGLDTPQETKIIGSADGFVNQGPENANNPTTQENDNGNEQTIEKSMGSSHILSKEEFQEVNRTYTENIKHLFQTDSQKEAWTRIENSTTTNAGVIMNMKEADISEASKPLWSYLHKIEEVTGLHPRGETIFQPAETSAEYIKHGLIKAAEVDKLEELKISETGDINTNEATETNINGIEEIKIEDLKDLKELTKGYQGIPGQPPLKMILDQITEKDLNSIVSEDTGKAITPTQLLSNARMNAELSAIGGKNFGDYYFQKELPDGNIKLMHIKLYK